MHKHKLKEYIHIYMHVYTYICICMCIYKYRQRERENERELIFSLFSSHNPVDHLVHLVRYPGGGIALTRSKSWL